MKNNFWKAAALTLARAIIRFQEDDYRLTHKEGTYNFARKVVRLNKQNKILLDNLPEV